MTQQMASLSDVIGPLGPTLADVLAKLAALPDPKNQSLRNKKSAINSFCRVLDCRPCDAPISGKAFRVRVARAIPGAFHISSRRWTNIVSDVRGAIRFSGLTTLEPELTVPLGDLWLQVIARVARKEHQGILRRFARFCSIYQIVPAHVDDRTIARYSEYLDKGAFSKAPQQTLACLLRVWNECVVQDPESGTRPLTRIKLSKRYSLNWSELPDSLAAEAAAYMAASLAPDPFDENSRAAVSAATAYGRDRLLRRVASAAILAGADPSEVATLRKLVSPRILKKALGFFWDRNGQKANPQIANATNLALVIAKHWVIAPEAEVQELRRLAKKFKRVQTGLTAKNRERLGQFRDQGVIRKLLELPAILMAEAERKPDSWFSARSAETAVAIALLIQAPVRLRNLGSVDRQRHFKRAFSTKNPSMLLAFPASEVKNAVDLEFPIDPAIMHLIDRYLQQFQPLLAGGHDTTMLFPSPSGGAKRDNNLRAQITDCIWRRLGIRINPHLFRHLAALLFLEAHPGQYEQVRRLLGQKNIATTINFYAGLEARAATTQYQKVVLRLRAGVSDAERSHP